MSFPEALSLPCSTGKLILTLHPAHSSPVLVYQYWTDAYCNSIWGASTYMRVGTYSGTCLCLKGEESQFLCPSASKGSDQAYCLQTKQTTLGDTSDPDPSPELARCDICSRTAGSPGTRSVPLVASGTSRRSERTLICQPLAQLPGFVTARQGHLEWRLRLGKVALPVDGR